MAEMHRLHIEDLSDEKLRTLYAAVSRDPEHVSLSEVVESIANEHSQVWQFEDMLFVTSLVRNGRGLKLVILYLAGQHGIKNAETLRDALVRLAASRGCYAIGGVTIRKGLISLYETIGAKEIKREFELEIANGQQDEHGSRKEH